MAITIQSSVFVQVDGESMFIEQAEYDFIRKLTKQFGRENKVQCIKMTREFLRLVDEDGGVQPGLKFTKELVEHLILTQNFEDDPY